MTITSKITEPAPATLRSLKSTHGESFELQTCGEGLPSTSNDPEFHPSNDPEPLTPPIEVKSVIPQMIICHTALFVSGISDASLGPLIPFIRPFYGLNFLLVSILYLIFFMGFMLAAFASAHLTGRFGTGGAFLIGTIFQAAGHLVQCVKPPFPVFAAAFLPLAFGVAIQDAQSNAFVGAVRNPHRWLGSIHATYGLGGLVAPLIGTAISSHSASSWRNFYFFPLGISVFNIALVSYSFRNKILFNAKGTSSKASKELKSVLTRPEVWTMALFFFLYVGTEVTAGGWVVSFLIDLRDGAPSKVGYVASGFWGGLTLGRLVLPEVTHRFNERKMIYLYLILAIGVQLMFWLIPNLIASAVMISLLGFLIGTFYPVGVEVLVKTLPEDLHVPSMGFVASVGQAGGAGFPFVTGAIAAKKGVGVLQPILVGLLGAMTVVWWAIPRGKRRRD